MDIAALSAFYANAGGAHWVRNDGWLQGAPCNSSTNRWFGLICDKHSSVTQLLMFSNQLTGTLATELGGLSNLTQLWLPAPDADADDAQGNSLSGSLPTQLGRLKFLTDLVLSSNSISGVLPTQLGEMLHAASSLTLDTNRISGTMPTQIGALTTLSYLGFDSNSLSGTIPTEAGRLRALGNFNVDSNGYLSGTVPTELMALTKLAWLDLYKNRLSGTLPSQLGSLALQTDLRVHANRFSGSLPSQLGALTSDYCYLSNRQCVHDAGGSGICASRESNRFLCPLPRELAAPTAACGGRGLNCTRRA